MSKYKPLVSIIVPVYNLEKVVARCLDSLNIQTYKNIEIIVVDDGSSDNSLIICQEYAIKDSRVIVIHKENGGLSSARNTGLEKSNGDLIVFVDGDDFVLPAYIENIVDAFSEGKADIVVTRFASGDESGFHYQVLQDVRISGSYRSLDFERLLYTCKNWYEHSMVVCVWGKGYKRKVFDDIRFKGRIYEDYAFTDEINSHNYYITVTDRIGYIYCYSPDSLTNKTSVLERTVFLEILINRLYLFADDEYIVNNTYKLFCNMYIEYYFKIDPSERIQLEKYQNQFNDCIYKLKENRLNDKKFLLRMYIFRISPILYRKLASMFSRIE